MARLTYMVIIGLLLMRGSRASETQPAPIKRSELRVVISAAREDVHVGAPVDLVLRVVNDTDRSLLYWERAPELMFVLQVTDQSGKVVGSTQFGRRMAHHREMVMGSMGPVRLRPGQAAAYMIRVNAYFDMSLPGKYMVRARYFSEMRPPGSRVTMKPSSTVQVSVKDIYFPEQGKVGAADLKIHR